MNMTAAHCDDPSLSDGMTGAADVMAIRDALCTESFDADSNLEHVFEAHGRKIFALASHTWPRERGIDIPSVVKVRREN